MTASAGRDRFEDVNHRDPIQATGRALAAERWSGALLDHMRPLEQLKRLGCTLEDRGLQSTTDGRQLPAVQVSMLDDFAETIFLDDRARIVAHRWDVPEAGEDEHELEVRVDQWGQYDGLVHPVRSTVLHRNTGETVAEIIVTDARFESYVREVFDLTAD